MFVRHIGVQHVDVAYPEETAWIAAARMHQRGVGALVIVDEAHVPIGIVTDRDLTERVMTKRLDPDETLLMEVMTARPQVIDDDATAEMALQMMRDGGFRRLPIVDRENRLCGIVCLDDILMHVADEFAAIGQVIRWGTPRAVAEETLLAEA